MYKLFIDDERFPTEDGWVITRSYAETIEMIETNGCPSFISFDHDIGDGPTGYDVAKWLVEKDLDSNNFIPNDFDFYVHSMNPVGAKNISMYLERYLTIKRG